MNGTYYEPEEIGDKGRRAAAWICKTGVVVVATDANVAGHAMAVVCEAMLSKGRKIPGQLRTWLGELPREFVPLPDASCSLREFTRGVMDKRAPIGHGWVRPTGQSHECGGALFNIASHKVEIIDIHDVSLFGGETS